MATGINCASGSKRSAGSGEIFLIVGKRKKSSTRPEPPPPPGYPAWVVPLILFVLNVVLLGIAGAAGRIQRLSEGAQFFYGAMTVAVPIGIYLFLKNRERKGR